VNDEDDREEFELNALANDREGDEVNPHEERARQTKVNRMVNMLRTALSELSGLEPAVIVARIDAFSEREWRTLELLANVKPSSETSRSMVIDEIREWANSIEHQRLSARKGWEL
jgi:hypothetical protein